MTYVAGGRTIRITHPERVLFPEDGYTKADLAGYHHTVAAALVPHLAGRPLMLQRFPEGIDAGGFYQKEAGRGVPDWLRTVEVAKEGGTVNHPVIDDEAGLLALTNLSTVSFHRWPSRADRVGRPDLLVVDLDPSGDQFDEVRRAAHWVREVFERLDLVPFVQTTGSRGIHVVAPLDRSADTATVAGFADDLARLLASLHPEQLTVATRKAKRGDRLYVDTARNAYAQTVITPYSVRPRRGAPVAAPITWEELDDPGLRPDGWTIATMPGRLSRVGDRWAGMSRRGRSLGGRRRRLLDRMLATAGVESAAAST
jgi:bifunctional non-homologous end joining protein LigD